MRDVAASVVFDLDGTLTDSGPGIVRSTRLGLERLNAAGGTAFPIPAATELRWIVGPPLQESFAKLAGADRAPTLLAYFRERYSTVGLFENSVYDGIVEALDRLTALDYRLFVATSKAEPYARRILDHFGLTKYFKQIYGGEMDGRRSAKSELLAYLMGRERIGATQRIVMIGDRRHDALGARAVGIPAIGALWGYGDAEELAAAGADPLIETPRQIPAAVAVVFARAK
ncbi:MAG: HAD-IA family hydrolase [Roseiarcus sp.]|jgi:phosphoglycolate phosphatase